MAKATVSVKDAGSGPDWVKEEARQSLVEFGRAAWIPGKALSALAFSGSPGHITLSPTGH